jgi:hypothetical protein
VQNNTNEWQIAGSNPARFAAVQFTIQSSGSSTLVCIYNIEVTKPSVYTRTCQSLGQRPGGLQPSDTASIAGQINANGNKQKLVLFSHPVAESDQLYFFTKSENDLAELCCKIFRERTRVCMGPKEPAYPGACPLPPAWPGTGGGYRLSTSGDKSAVGQCPEAQVMLWRVPMAASRIWRQPASGWT